MITEIDYDNRSGETLPEDVTQDVQRALEAALSEFSFEAGYQVSVSFVDEAEICALNRDYRSRDAVTDVLSFPMEDTDPRGVALLGDVVICVSQARRQAEEFGHTLQREICYLSVHSALHLMGYDHEQDSEKSEMRLLEKEIMAKMKVFKGGTRCES